MRPVKTQSEVRRESAEATRRRIIDAAQRLFVEKGYASTSIKEVAASASVAVQTIYWTFGNKAALVSGIRDAWLTRAHTAERLQAVLVIKDPHDRLAAAAAFMRHQWETGAEAVAVQQDAMWSDREIRRTVEAVLENRAQALAPIVEALNGHLRRDLEAEEALDIFIALLGFELYRELRNRGWSADRYEAWLARTLQESLLRRAGDTGPPAAER
jgi:AcrR family transcriptional regulator